MEHKVNAGASCSNVNVTPSVRWALNRSYEKNLSRVPVYLKMQSFSDVENNDKHMEHTTSDLK
jgi:hypothetical protein